MAGLLGIGQSALMAAYAQLQTTGHNISNASTPGYSRQEAVFATAGGTWTGGGFLGMGVDLVTVQRRYDRFLTGELASSTASASADGARAAHLERLQRVIGDTDNGIGAALDGLNSALADVVNRAGDPTARQTVLQRAETLAQRIRTADSQMRALGADADDQVARATDRVNELLDQYAGLNARITQVSGSGHMPNDLLDERDRVLMQLNEYLKVSAHEQDDGTMNLFAAGGEGLLVGTRAARFVVDADPADASKQRIVLAHGSALLPMSADSFGGGSIAGLMRFRDGDLAQTREQLSRLAAGIEKAYNDQQALGVDASGAAGKPMFRYAGGVLTRVLESGAGLATGYAVTAQLPGTNVGDVRIAAFSVASVGAALSDPVSIVFDGVGNYTIHTAAGPVASAAYAAGTPISFNGWSVTTSGTPQSGDTIEIVANASPGTDNRNARAMLGLADRPLLGGATLNDAFASMLADVGSRTQSAQSSRTASDALRSNAHAAQTEHAGVNLDEEAARLMQYQQMYQAAAKVIQAAQSMFDALLAATAR